MRFKTDTFKNICSSDISPVYSWIWNSEITKELIEKQLNEMLLQGIRAVYIIPEPKEFRPYNMVTYMEPDYLSDEFFELVKYAIEYAKELNISMWLYDEGGWPSGKACGKVVEKYPDCRAKRIIETEIFVKKGDTVSGEWYISLFDECLNQLPVPYTAKADEKLFAYSINLLDTDIPDLLDERAVDEFIECTYVGYRNSLGKLFGNTVTAIFTDEPILCYPFYLKNVKEFEKKSGFDFAGNVPALFNRNVNDDSEKFRVEYIDFCSKEFEKRFMKRLHKWCCDNNIKFVGHMDGDDTPESFAKQVGNALRHLRHMDIPGVDVILRQIFPGNESNNFFPRLASSAAAQTGKKYALSESFAVYGDSLTFDEMRYVCNYQFVRGINIINIMSVTSGRDRYLLGQCRPHFIPELPLSQYMSEFNAYISRMMYLGSIGKAETKTALYMPMRDVWAGNNDSHKAFLDMGKSLEEDRVYFDIIDDDFLEQCKIVNDTLCMKNARYKKIYIPASEYMSEKSAKVLKQFRENGGRIFYTVTDTDSIVECSKSIRVMKRATQNETIYFLFNESDKRIKEKIAFNENKKGYILDCVNGTVKKLDNFEFDFCSGEMYTVLFAEDEIECDTTHSIAQGEAIILKEFDKEIINCVKYERGKLVCVDAADTKSFSGTVRYSTEFEFDNSYDAVIDLGKVYYAAKIIINGTEIKNLIMSPFVTVVDKSFLNKRNKLEIIVSNTAANAFLTADYKNAQKSAIGPYHETTLEFEKENVNIGITEVKIFKRGI